MKIEKQAISISIGLFGGFLGIMMSRAPKVLRRILPWGYIGVLSPVKMISLKVGDGAVASFIPKTGFAIREIIYFLVAVGLMLLFSSILKKKNRR
ncbi:LPXTG cell wall anchor domain-containing protein [Anaerosalibacter sp. Marseille-P3206]|uniref:LPXTG cell wall anchor domain-containing protein n=1 Tax=Anaerosalibacter sp. Marseille-P3206 TaxID=1871005 RepID=UPI0013566D37|nr:LPXTG cell wall anchor domain-containing protein [Anaerosalibacter sp. Marseille-P3206]